MSALGQNRTSGGRLGYVRFTFKSGHPRADLAASALCHEPTIATAATASFRHLPRLRIRLSAVSDFLVVKQKHLEH